MISETLSLKAIKFNGFKIELTTNIKGQPVARFYKFITVGKNKGQYKLLEGYYFANEEKREAWVKKTFESMKARVEEKQKEKAKKAAIQNDFVNPFKVGEIFYDSWGYDQTNIDFYQIAEVKGKSVMVQKIGQTMVAPAGDMCEYVKPNPEKKIGEPYLKQVRFSINSNDGKPSFFLKSNHGWISPYTDGDKGVYQSHYA
jgi:hypothetical protein